MSAWTRTRPLLAGLAIVGSIHLSPWSLEAQTPPPPSLADDPLFASLFTPEEIMQHRRAINLTDEQRDAISQLLAELQGRVISLQWELLDDMQALSDVADQPRVDLDLALDQIDSVLDLEREIKRAHLEMLVRIKNLLSPDQQATLEGLREAGPPGD
jgi:Spy/CpxP family protein refolding chaperone